MTRFTSTMTSETEAINNLADRVDQLAQSTITVDTDGGTIGLTAAQTINSGLMVTGGSTSTISIATAAALVAALKNCQVGSSFRFWVHNAGSGTATLAAVSGITYVGVTNVATTKAQMYWGVVTNATSGTEAVSLYGLGYAAF